VAGATGLNWSSGNFSIRGTTEIGISATSPETVEQYGGAGGYVMHPHIEGLTDWKPLARGGFAVVWQARQLSLDRLVAVKVYQHELNERDRRRLLHEAAAAGKLSDHPGIITAYDAGTLLDDRPYLIMELCPGGSLTQWFKPENRPSEEQVRQVGIRIADALAAAHACGILHRDVKPANILIDGFGNPGLADFGLAAVAGTESTTVDGLRVTPAYAPPEAFEMHAATEAGDVFSLAATLYALLAGRPPRDFGADPVPLEQMAVVAQRPFDPLPEVNWYLMDVLLSGLSNDPAARPTAAQFRDRLTQVPPPRTGRRGSTHTHRAPARGAVAEPSRRRSRVRVAVLALATAVVTIGASATAWMIIEPASSSRVPATGVQSATGLPPTAGTTPTTESESATSSTEPGAAPDSAPGEADSETIQLADSTDFAKPYQLVRIHGTYRGGAETFLRVQRWESGRWVDFPLPSKTDQAGQFTTYVEFGQPGRYRLRVLDVDSGVKSEPFALVIKG
jgi:serine/threonine protein kinase